MKWNSDIFKVRFKCPHIFRATLYIKTLF